MLFETGQRLDVSCPISADGYGHIVAAVLALFADLTGNPPHGGMIEEQGFDHGLGEVDQPIVTSHMGQLVG